jgi:hypothetical protein
MIKVNLKVLIYEKLNIDKGMDISWESAENNKNHPFLRLAFGQFNSIVKFLKSSRILSNR